MTFPCGVLGCEHGSQNGDLNLPTKNIMNTYTFALDAKTFSTDAATYAEALAALVFEVGSEAAEYTFIG